MKLREGERERDGGETLSCSQNKPMIYISCLSPSLSLPLSLSPSLHLFLGCYLFELRIPSSYPFKNVDVFSKQPIWHPNIELQSGRVALPIEWSPVLTLNSLAMAVQVKCVCYQRNIVYI